MLFSTTALVTNTASGMKLPFDVVKDFTPLGQIAATPLVVVVPASSPFKTMRELIDHARANPGKLNFGSSGIGSISHIGMELVASLAKVRMLHLPYRGTSLAANDLVAGQLQAMLGSFATTWQLVEARKLRALVVTGPQRVAQAPHVPTVAEMGLAGAEVELWYGLMGPARLPARTS